MIKKLQLALCTILLAGITIFALPERLTAAKAADDLEIALDLATMLRSARSVIAENQKHINDPEIADKGLSGDVVQARALEKFSKVNGGATLDLETDNQRSRLLKAQIQAIGKVMDQNQATINHACR